MQFIKTCAFGIYSLFIAYVSLANDSSPDATMPDLNSFGIPNLDKIAHTGAYALFMILAVITFGTKRTIPISIAVLLYGFTLEILQSWIPLRESSLADFLANAIGIFCGSFFMQVLAKLPTNRLTNAIIPNIKSK